MVLDAFGVLPESCILNTQQCPSGGQENLTKVKGASGIISLKAADVVDIRSVRQTNIVAGTILDLDSGGGSPTSTNRINLN
tara:strand:+ start:101 stop:343 length:243 start_codon:yes stop_codon:yes gene_type:complete